MTIIKQEGGEPIVRRLIFIDDMGCFGPIPWLHISIFLVHTDSLSNSTLPTTPAKLRETLSEEQFEYLHHQ